MLSLLRWVTHFLSCWFSLCWVSLCWFSLCWFSWSRIWVQQETSSNYKDIKLLKVYKKLFNTNLPLRDILFFPEKKKKLFVMARYSMLVLFHSLSRKVLPNTLNLPFQASLNNLLYIFKIFLTFFTKQEVNLMRGVIVRGLPPKCKQIPEAFIIFMACV